MTNILLKELSNADINWLIAIGQRQQIAQKSVLLRSREDPKIVYLLLDGVLTVGIPVSDCADTQAANGNEIQPIARLNSGEIVGETALLNTRPIAATLIAAEDSTVLSIPQPQLATKLQTDLGFSTHFYRAIALILSERLRQMLEMPSQLRAASNQPMKEALFVFGELLDSDVDWLMMAGRVEKLAPGQILVQIGRPLDALYIILDGLLAVAVVEGNVNPLNLCFERAEKNARSQKIIDRLSRGEMSGTVSFLESNPSPVTVQAIEESLVLSISRSHLALKLQQDMGFASRFYRVLAIQLSETWQAAIGLMGCPQQMYQQHQSMDDEMEYDDELDLESLHQVSQGAARFSWMLKQLGVV